MADSGTYDPETVARHQAIAATLLKQATAPREIRSRLQGAGQLGEGLLAGLQSGWADKEAKDSRAEAVAQALAAFGGGGGQAAPAAMPTPATAPVGADPSMPSVVASADQSQVPIGSSQAVSSVPTPDQYRPIMEKSAVANGVNPETMARLLNQESGFNPNATSPAGAQGIAQFMPATAKQYGVNPNDPSSAIPGASKYLGDLTKQFGGNEGLALAAYNWGPGNVQKWVAGGADPAKVPAETQKYVQAITGKPIETYARVAGALNPGGGGGEPQPSPQNAPAGPAGTGPNREAIIKALMNPWTPPAVGSLLAQQGFAKPELKDAGTDPITGAKSYQEYDPNTHTMRPVTGAPGTPQASAQPGMLAQGVSQIDHTLSGDAYLNQFGPEIKAAVKSYMNGDVLPTGNPRMAGIANAAKTIAQKYGQDTGQPVSDSLYAEKRKYRTELGSNMPSTAGGQAKAFNQGIEHMGALATTLENLDNSNGLGVPFLADIINKGRQMTSTEQAAISDKARGIGQTLSGEVGKLFSGSAGGGVEERRLTRDRFDSVKSPKQMAAALEGTLETMRGGLTALEGRRDQILGPKNDVKFITADTEKKIAQIEAAISRLKGEKQGGDAVPAAAEGGLPAGWSVKVH